MPEPIELQGNNPAGQPVNDQPVQTPVGAGDQSGQPEAKYLTQQEAQKLIDDALKRQKQSFSDTLSDRVKKEWDRLQTAGIQATPEQVAQLVNSEPEGKEIPQQSPVQQLASQPPAQGDGSQTLDPVETQAIAWMKEDGVESDPLLLEAYKIQAEEGVHITDEDPEARKITRGKNLFETMQSIHAAVLEKKERLARQGSPARMPSLAGGGAPSVPNYAGMRSTEIFEDYYSRKG